MRYACLARNSRYETLSSPQSPCICLSCRVASLSLHTFQIPSKKLSYFIFNKQALTSLYLAVHKGFLPLQNKWLCNRHLQVCIWLFTRDFFLYKTSGYAIGIYKFVSGCSQGISSSKKASGYAMVPLQHYVTAVVAVSGVCSVLQGTVLS